MTSEFLDKVIDPTALNLDVRRYDKDEAWCICPFHDDHSPSATFNIYSGLFHCFTCGTGKSAEQLKRELDGSIIYVKSLKKVRQDFLRTTDESWRRNLGAMLANGNSYLKARKVSDGFVKLYGLRELPYGIGFPILNNREVVTGMQIRQYPGRNPRYLYMGIRQPLWPIQNLSAIHLEYANPLIVTEGVFSALRVMSAGYNSVAVMGAGNILPAIRMLSGRNYLVVFDGDDAGYFGAAKFASLGKSVAIVPHRFEADEIGKRELKRFLDHCDFTDDYEVVAENSTDPRKTHYLAKSFLRSVKRKRRSWK